MIPASVRVLVCTQPIDMRRSFDGLLLAVRQATGQELLPNTLVCFLNRRGSHLKAIWRDSTGVCLLYKRAHQAVFRVPVGSVGGVVTLEARRLAELVAGERQSKTNGRSGLSEISKQGYTPLR